MLVFVSIIHNLTYTRPAGALFVFFRLFPRLLCVRDCGDSSPLARAAAYLRVDESEVLQMVKQQELPGRQIGSEWRFFRAALQAWLGNVSGSPGTSFAPADEFNEPTWLWGSFELCGPVVCGAEV